MSNNLQSVKQRFGIIGRSEALDRALATAVRVANTDLSVLITGESGVGKEVFSKIIHNLSSRKHNGFIAINTGAIPEGTINSELFGHERGAFTGATGERKGYFETYNKGTIFLDEIGEMPLDTQAFLLRVLESGEFIRVGSSKVLTTDVRIIAATNVDLQSKVKEGKFREDLYFRLNTVPIKVPALRQRPEDIYMLFRKFVVDFAEKYRTPPIQLDERATLLLENYSWPGNIRELKNVAEQLSVLAEDRFITAETLISLMPNINKRNLPAITNPQMDQGSFQEREILYKLLFDMRWDLTELKKLVFELIRSNNLTV
ncbi:MAG: sigma-54 dependent transcriptional regulator, partial [Bacteroidota bacterium]